ncbi:MAG: UDP-N-acetylmuramate dehydrogenase [Bacteroidales bacterium]|nr:UDP-N-acetylmuramate dehydrogenase [Bacteroidales bacterium]
MVKVYENYPLKQHNTFGIDVKAKYFVVLPSVENIKSFLATREFKNKNKLILGSGSNTIFTHDYNGVVIIPDITGINIVRETKKSVILKVGAGVIWDRFVEYCVNHNFSGIENLSNIPGTVGSSPIQNIGAYGVEVKNVVIEVEAINIKSQEKKIFKKEECNFGYRDSIFKNELKGQYLITNVFFKLSKEPRYNTSYGILNEEVNKLGEVNLKNIRDAVINIRSKKLPDPISIGNAGSFFKNPIVDYEGLKSLKLKHRKVPVFKASRGMYKIPAAWLIEQCNFKGVKHGNTGTYENQPLVLVNHGNASGKEVINFAGEIVEAVKNEFGIELEMEVNVV